MNATSKITTHYEVRSDDGISLSPRYYSQYYKNDLRYNVEDARSHLAEYWLETQSTEYPADISKWHIVEIITIEHNVDLPNPS
jgi:hypothetical protein